MAQPHPVPARIYKIATAEAMASAREAGRFEGMPIDFADGYIHFSTASQLAETLRLHFRGQSGLVLFALDTAALGAELKWEASRGGNLFPHLYATFPMDRIVWEGTVDVGADGSVDLPAGVQ